MNICQAGRNYNVRLDRADNILLGDDEPHDDDLKLGMSKEDFFWAKRHFACLNAFGIGYEEKMRK